MGSTVCVRCGANLVPHSYCDICDDVLSFVCSSCSMNTIERIHAYCHNAHSLTNNNDNVYWQDSQEPISSQLVINDSYINTHNYIQNHLNDKIKDSSIRLSASYWDNVFETIKLVNAYWSRTFNTGNSSSLVRL